MTQAAKQHRRALYMDLEWNCGDGPPIPGRYQEIIEIVVVEVDLNTLEITSEEDYLIRPRHLDISAACKRRVCDSVVGQSCDFDCGLPARLLLKEKAMPEELANI